LEEIPLNFMKHPKWTRVEENLGGDKQSIVYDIIVDDDIQLTIFLDECGEKLTEVSFSLWLNGDDDINLKKRLVRKSLREADKEELKTEALNLVVKFLEKKINKVKSLIQK